MTFRRQRETRGRCVGHNGGVGTGAWRLRALLAVLTGGLVVHALRYGLAGVDADHAAHAYLPWLQIVVATLVLAAVVEFAVCLRRIVGSDAERASEPPRARVLWPALSAALVLLVGGQEAAELRWLAATNHDAGGLLTALLADGGWLILPLSVVVGGACALLLRGAAALARALQPAPLLPRRNASPARVCAAAGWRPLGDVLARALAGRAPPLLVVL